MHALGLTRHSVRPPRAAQAAALEPECANRVQRSYHGSGAAADEYGPTFGPGDVVGCGYSVHSCAIFFTHNGRYLGSPFAAQPSQLPLHPLVGIDSRAPLTLNFGHTPFAFDLDATPLELNERRGAASGGGGGCGAAASTATALKRALRRLVSPF